MPFFFKAQGSSQRWIIKALSRSLLWNRFPSMVETLQTQTHRGCNCMHKTYTIINHLKFQCEYVGRLQKSHPLQRSYRQLMTAQNVSVLQLQPWEATHVPVDGSMLLALDKVVKLGSKCLINHFIKAYFSTFKWKYMVQHDMHWPFLLRVPQLSLRLKYAE